MKVYKKVYIEVEAFQWKENSETRKLHNGTIEPFYLFRRLMEERSHSKKCQKCNEPLRKQRLVGDLVCPNAWIVEQADCNTQIVPDKDFKKDYSIYDEI